MANFFAPAQRQSEGLSRAIILLTIDTKDTIVRRRARLYVMLNERVVQSFMQQGLMQHLGVTLLSADGGRCVLEVGSSPKLTQQHGFFHAGVTSAIADTAAGYAAMTLTRHDQDILTIEFKINLLKPANGKRLRAEAGVIRTGRSIIVTRAVVSAEYEAGFGACAEFLGTMYVLERRASNAHPA